MRDTKRTQEFRPTRTTGRQEAGRGVEIRTDLSECGYFAVLSEVELQRTSELLHDLAGRGWVSYGK